MYQPIVMSIQYHILSYSTSLKHVLYVWEAQVGHQNPIGVILPSLKSSQTHRQHWGHQNPHPQSALEITSKYSEIGIK